jgi:hypothetical protein
MATPNRQICAAFVPQAQQQSLGSSRLVRSGVLT